MSEEKTTRLPRALQGRSMQERMPERDPIAHNIDSRFYIPPSLQDKYPDKIFGWIRYSYAGNVEDQPNYEQAVDDGWTPAPADVWPAFGRRKVASPFERKEGSEDSLIRRDGHIFMWMDRVDYQTIRSRYDEATHRQGMFRNQLADPSMVKLHDERRWESR